MASTSERGPAPPFLAQQANITITSPGRNILTPADIEELGSYEKAREALIFISLGGVEQSMLQSLLASVAGKAKAFRAVFVPGGVKEKIRVVTTNSLHNRHQSVACHANYGSMGKVMYDNFRVDTDGLVYCRQSLDTGSRMMIYSLLSQSERIDDALDVSVGALEVYPDKNNQREFCDYLKTLAWTLEFKIDSMKKLENHRWASLFLKRNCATWCPSHLEASVDYLENTAIDTSVSIESRIEAAQQAMDLQKETGATINWTMLTNEDDEDDRPGWIRVKPHGRKEKKKENPTPFKKFIPKAPGEVGDKYEPKEPETKFKYKSIGTKFDEINLSEKKDSFIPHSPPKFSSTPKTKDNVTPREEKSKEELLTARERFEKEKQKGREDILNTVRGAGETRPNKEESKKTELDQTQEWPELARRAKALKRGENPTPRREVPISKRQLSRDHEQRESGPPRKQSSPGPVSPETKPLYPSNLLKDVDEFSILSKEIQTVDSDEEAFLTAHDILSSTLIDRPNTSGDKTPTRDEEDDLCGSDLLEGGNVENTPYLHKADEAQMRIKSLNMSPAAVTLPLNLAEVDNMVAQHIIMSTGRPLATEKTRPVSPFLEDEPVRRDRTLNLNQIRTEKLNYLSRTGQMKVRDLDKEIARLSAIRDQTFMDLSIEERDYINQTRKQKMRTTEQIRQKAIDKEIQQSYRNIKLNKKEKRKLAKKRAMMESLFDILVSNDSDDVDENDDEEEKTDEDSNYETIEERKAAPTKKEGTEMGASSSEHHGRNLMDFGGGGDGSSSQ